MGEELIALFVDEKGRQAVSQGPISARTVGSIRRSSGSPPSPSRSSPAVAQGAEGAAAGTTEGARAPVAGTVRAAPASTVHRTSAGAAMTAVNAAGESPGRCAVPKDR